MNNMTCHHAPGTSGLLLLFVEIAILLCIMGTVAASSQGSPENCNQTCEFHIYERDAHCTRRNLTEVPSMCNDCQLIDLSHNFLSFLEKDTFSSFSELMFLDLSENNLQELLPRQFQGAPRLTHVYLIDNELQELKHYTFYGLANMIQLHISSNRIQLVSNTAFKGMTGLKVLFLSHNRITYISRHLFEGNKELTHLNLADNQIEILHPHVFDKLSKLEHIDLSFNKLVTLSSPAFQNLPRLTVLKATHNNLTADAIMGRLSGSSANIEKEIDVRYNLIETVPLLDVESDLGYLRLANNPLICDCSFEQLQALYLLMDVSWVEEVTCINGEPLVNIPLSCHLPTTGKNALEGVWTTSVKDTPIPDDSKGYEDIIIIIFTIVTIILLIATIFFPIVYVCQYRKYYCNNNNNGSDKKIVLEEKV